MSVLPAPVGADDDVAALPQCGDGLLLPEVRHGHRVQDPQVFELFGHRAHAGKIIEPAECEMAK